MIKGLKASPFYECLAVVTPDELYVWLHEEKVTQEIIDHLNAANCETTKTCAIRGEYNNAMNELVTDKEESSL